MTIRKRPRDPTQLAKLMIDIASGEVEDRDLSRQPLGRQMARHLEPQQLPAAMAHDQKREQARSKVRVETTQRSMAPIACA
jgi:hypothetical protein